MTHFYRKICFVYLTFCSFACQNNLLNKNYIYVKMLGVSETPSGAKGTSEPINQQYTLKDILITDENKDQKSIFSDNTIVTNLFRIINRTQIIYQNEIKSTEVGLKFLTFTCVFEKNIINHTKYSDAETLALKIPQISYSKAFTVGKGQDLVFVIKVKWKETVTRDDSTSTDLTTPPELEISFTQ